MKALITCDVCGKPLQDNENRLIDACEDINDKTSVLFIRHELCTEFNPIELYLKIKQQNN
jgi:hypothetical protein